MNADGPADVELFPHFWDRALPPPLRCEVHAGEVLYLPAGWYHQVRSCSFCVFSNSALLSRGSLLQHVRPGRSSAL